MVLNRNGPFQKSFESTGNGAVGTKGTISTIIYLYVCGVGVWVCVCEWGVSHVYRQSESVQLPYGAKSMCCVGRARETECDERVHPPRVGIGVRRVVGPHGGLWGNVGE